MALTRNVGSTDKMIRLVLGAALILWAVLGAGFTTTMGVIAAVVGAVLVVTGLVNFCPLFKVLGISSFRSS